MLLPLRGDNFPVFHANHLIRHLCNILIVRHDHDRLSVFASHTQQKLQHQNARIAVKRAGWLVAEQNFRIFGKRAGNGNTLLFAARKLRREIVHSVFKTDVFQHFFGRKRIFAYLRRKFNIFFRRQVIDQIIKLEHEPDIVAAIVSQLFF